MTCPVVGLVGGVGSGKSTLTRRAAELFGLVAIDGDAAGHRALADSTVKFHIQRHFGESVLASDGTIDRAALAALVFGTSSEHERNKAMLEQLTHPVICREFHQRIASARATAAPAVLLDAAVLLEAGWRDLCDAVLFIDVPDHLRRSRVAARGWSEAHWRRREASQLSLAEKRRQADAVIDNSGVLDTAVEALVAAIERICGLRLPRLVTTPM